MIFISVERIRSLAMKISVFLTVCFALMAAPFRSVRAQTAYPEIEPVNVSVHPRVGEEAREAPPAKAMTKRAGSSSLWSSLQPAKRPANTLFRLSKAYSPAMETLSQASGSSSSPEVLATPKTGFSSDTPLPGDPDGSANTRSTGQSSSAANAPVHVMSVFSQNQTHQSFAKGPLSRDLGFVTPQLKMYGLGANMERSQPKSGSISPLRESLRASSVQPTGKRAKSPRKKSSSSAESGTPQALPPSRKHPIN